MSAPLRFRSFLRTYQTKDITMSWSPSLVSNSYSTVYSASRSGNNLMEPSPVSTLGALPTPVIPVRHINRTVTLGPLIATPTQYVVRVPTPFRYESIGGRVVYSSPLGTTTPVVGTTTYSRDRSHNYTVCSSPYVPSLASSNNYMTSVLLSPIRTTVPGQAQVQVTPPQRFTPSFLSPQQLHAYLPSTPIGTTPVSAIQPTPNTAVVNSLFRRLDQQFPERIDTLASLRDTFRSHSHDINASQ